MYVSMYVCIKKDLYVWSLGTKLIQNVSNTSRHISQAYEMTVTYRDLIDHGGVLLYRGYEMIFLLDFHTYGYCDAKCMKLVLPSC